MKLKEGLQPIIINPLNASACLMLYIDVDIDVDIDMYVDRDGDTECIITVSKVIKKILYVPYLTIGDIYYPNVSNAAPASPYVNPP